MSANERARAAQILANVFTHGQSLATLSEGGFVQELCYGTLRWYWQLNGIAKLLLDHSLKPKDNDIYALILIGLYQLLYLQTPAHAAIHETVQAARVLKKLWAVGLINGVLRQFQRQQENLLKKIAQDPVTFYAHPAWLITQLKKSYPNHWQVILENNNQRPPMTLRVNRLQTTRENYLSQLPHSHIAIHTTHGITLAEPCNVDQLPGFHDGVVSVQDAAAQLAAELLELAPGQTVLDACAAPGGKTAHILETEPKLKKLVAIDKDPNRLKKISENLTRLKLPDITLLCADVSKSIAPHQQFDRILIDAPCSATGVIRRHPDIKLLRRVDDIPTLADLQYQILTNLWSLLKPGGLLVYATCSLLPQENSEVLQRFLSEHSNAQEKIITADWGIKTSIGRQILPGSNGMDGFYYGRIEKLSEK